MRYSVLSSEVLLVALVILVVTVISLLSVFQTGSTTMLLFARFLSEVSSGPCLGCSVLQAVNYFRKRLHLKSLARFWKRLCKSQKVSNE